MSRIISDARKQQIGELKQIINNLQHSLNQVRNDNAAHVLRIAQLQKRINLKDEQLQNSFRKYGELRQRATQLQATEVTCKKEIQRLMDVVESKNRQIDVASFGFAHAKQRVIQFQSQASSLQTQVARLNQVIKQRNLQLKQLNKQAPYQIGQYQPRSQRTIRQDSHRQQFRKPNQQGCMMPKTNILPLKQQKNYPRNFKYTPQLQPADHTHGINDKQLDQQLQQAIMSSLGNTIITEVKQRRIQILPNHRKQDLSGKLNFVVVFQAIEIQRLSLEIDTLMFKIKDYERQLCNYQKQDMQIRQLTEKCHSYELLQLKHQQDMQKISKICQQLYNELEEMRARYKDIKLQLKQKQRLEKQRSQILVFDVQKWKSRYSASEISKEKQQEDM